MSICSTYSIREIAVFAFFFFLGNLDCGYNLVCEWVMIASQGVDDEDEIEFGIWTPVASGRGRGKGKTEREALGRGHGSLNRK